MSTAIAHTLPQLELVSAATNSLAVLIERTETLYKLACKDKDWDSADGYYLALDDLRQAAKKTKSASATLHGEEYVR